jgi:UDP-N-acetylmuramyl pentapeptide phosphotransferase/UDP-N-acetylglucosamine-1-phosphate transferase
VKLFATNVVNDVELTKLFAKSCGGGDCPKQEAEMGSIILFLVFLASVFLVDYLARERGWKRSRWTLAAVILGPLAIPLIYLVDAAHAVRKMISAPRP